MHYIQKHILDELRTGDTIRYTVLNNEGIESGHFRYHLQELVKDGYVEQVERGLYRLNHKGQQFVDKLSGQRVKATPMPKVITYTLLRDNEKVLLQEKQKQPYLGLLNMIGGKLHEGETSAQAAVREVVEKTGVIIPSPRLAGIFEVLISKDGDLLTHAVAWVYVAEIVAVDFTSASLQALSLSALPSTPNLAPDFLPIFRKVHDSQQIAVDVIKVSF